jgi:hypothetical protein
MKKIFLVFICIFEFIYAEAQTLYSFTSSPYVNVTTNFPNTTGSNITISSGTILTNVTSGAYFSSEPYIDAQAGWISSTQNGAKEFCFTITPASNVVSYSITNFSFPAYATAAGPSAAGFSIQPMGGTKTFYAETNLPSAGTTTTTVGSLIFDQNSLTGATTICIQGWLNGSRTSTGGGNFRIDELDLTLSSVLPIKLLAFDVTNIDNSNEIYFSTATEINNSHFNIEHSLDGRNFDIVGEIKGAGTSTTIKDYTFIHENVPSGVNYYRLTQVDYDGKSETFEVKSVKVEGEKTFRAFPSEITDFLNIETDFPVILYDAMGKEQMKIKTSDKINISNLVNGIYFLKSGNETIKIRKI